MRRSAIEFHPNVSEAPHLRSSVPRPKIDFVGNFLPMNNPIAQVSKNAIFRNKIGIPTISG